MQFFMRISRTESYDCKGSIGQAGGGMWGGMSKPRGKVWNGPQMSPKVGNRVGSQNKPKKKDLEFSPKSLILHGGDDETRTRDLRRDRPAF